MVESGVNPALVENGARMLGMPMGALLISDTIGLDLSYHAGATQARERGEEPRRGIIASLVVDHERIGAKTGKGFYDHAGDGSRRLWPGLCDLLPTLAAQPAIDEVKARILYATLAEAARAFAEGILLDVVDGDLGATLGVGFPAYLGGPFTAMDTLGLAAVIAECDRLAAQYGDLYRLPDAVRQMAAQGRTFYGDNAAVSPGARQAA
jgi:3-hydroxyacyl-CoA dehydrogenase/enoyl-CoA hydratase/3-hydroxybutyryl-CoA epimerase